MTDTTAQEPFELAQQAADALRERTGVDRYKIALTLGSGWGGAADLLGETVSEVPAHEIPGFSKPALEGHGGTLRSIRLADGSHALVIGARTHFYEGKGVRAVSHGVRTAAAAGSEIMILTNGCGGLNPDWAPGTPVLIRDHLNLTARSPLEGATFVDLTDLYSQRLRDIASRWTPPWTRGSTPSSPARTTRLRLKCRWPRCSARTSWACPPRWRPSRHATRASRSWGCPW